MLSDLLNIVNQYFLVIFGSIAAIIAVITIVIAGLRRSGGDPKSISKSNTVITNIITGFLILGVIGILMNIFQKSFVEERYTAWCKEVFVNSSDETQNASEASAFKKILIEMSGGYEEPECDEADSVIDPTECTPSKTFGFEEDGGILDGVLDVKKLVLDSIKVVIKAVLVGVGEIVISGMEFLGIDFFLTLPVDVFKDARFKDLMVFAEVISIGALYLLVIWKYLSSIIFSLTREETNDLLEDIGKFLLSIIGIFIGRFVALAVLTVADGFASLMFRDLISQGLLGTLSIIISEQMWSGIFHISGIPLWFIFLSVFLVIFLYFMIRLLVKNAYRYFILLILTVLSPFFTAALFIDDYRSWGVIFWKKFASTAFSVIFDMLIFSVMFIFVSENLTPTSLMVILVIMGIASHSQVILQQISELSEVQSSNSLLRSVNQSTGAIARGILRLTTRSDFQGKAS